MNVIGNVAGTNAQQGSYAPKVDSAPAEAPVITEVAVSAPARTNAQSGGNEGQENQKEASQEAVRKAVSDINRRSNGTEAIFGFHDKTNRITIKILDKETKDVIREVPAEQTLDLIAKVWEMAGLMVDEKR